MLLLFATYKAVITSHLPSGSVVKNPPDHSGDTGDVGLIPELGRSPGGGMATHSGILARRIPWTEEPGGLQAMGSQSQTWLSMTFLGLYMPPSPCVLLWSSLRASVLILSSYRDTRHSGLGPTHMTSFHLNYFFQGPISSPFLRYWGMQYMDF